MREHTTTTDVQLYDETETVEITVNSYTITEMMITTVISMTDLPRNAVENMSHEALSSLFIECMNEAKTFGNEIELNQ